MSAPVQSCQPIPEPVRQHTPTPWTYSDVSGAGLEIRAPVYQVAGVELPKGMPEAPIKIFEFTAPQIVQIAAERWVQFEPAGWSEMQEANAAFIVEAVNNHELLKQKLEFAEFEWNRATEGMQERDTTIATLKAQVEQLESNAREQAKLLADTGRRVEEMERIAADCEEASKIYSTQAGRSLSTERVSDIYRRLSVSIRAAMSVLKGDLRDGQA